ncbi:hypothetical protein PSA5_00530 [Pseudomonas syringae pv. actinidiae]|nr:hypothetical protein PSA5_00530 [Pseudomonas syringae pv. actinidiae]
MGKAVRLSGGMKYDFFLAIKFMSVEIFDRLGGVTDTNRRQQLAHDLLPLAVT